MFDRFICASLGFRSARVSLEIEGKKKKPGHFIVVRMSNRMGLETLVLGFWTLFIGNKVLISAQLKGNSFWGVIILYSGFKVGNRGPR